MAWGSRFIELAAQCVDSSISEPLSIHDAIETCRAFGLDVARIEHDLMAILEERLAMWLVGDVPSALNFMERAELLHARLHEIAPALSDETRTAYLVDALVECHAGILANLFTKKDRISTVPEPVLTNILIHQGYRCAVCGVPVAARAALPCARFRDGNEPVLKADLDHTIPYYLGGNQGNLRVLCKPCNVLKTDRLGVQEDALVVVGNHLRRRHRTSTLRRMSLWTLELSAGCSADACKSTARDSMLWVRRARTSGPWVVGNLVAECSAHATDDAKWIHDDYLDATNVAL
jgi:hypothetical protein